MFFSKYRKLEKRMEILEEVNKEQAKFLTDKIVECSELKMELKSKKRREYVLERKLGYKKHTEARWNNSAIKRFKRLFDDGELLWGFTNFFEYENPFIMVEIKKVDTKGKNRTVVIKYGPGRHSDYHLPLDVIDFDRTMEYYEKTRRK